MPLVKQATQPHKSVSRRDFLAVGGLSMVGLSVAEQAAVKRARQRSGDRSCILIVMAGGASQLETFDPKPNAPREVRGPLKAISTSLPGVQFSECLPRLAERADRLTVLRSLYHEAAPTHETGLQLLQTGRLSSQGHRYPSIGSMVSRLLGPRGRAPAHVMLPGRLTATGVETYRGDRSCFLGDDFEAILPEQSDDQLDDEGCDGTLAELTSFGNESRATREAYGDSRFGRQLLLARQLVEHGVRFVTVNTFSQLEGRATWDAHADREHAPGTLYDYRDTIGPQFDQACAALLDDLQERGLWDDTLVVCSGEFGRTPQLNEYGGRDHWTNAWSAMMAGCGLPEGQVIGETDACAAEPTGERVELSQVAATIYNRLRIERSIELQEDWPLDTLCDATPISSLVG
ncbi:MAG: DUF1501 domain-containing protein [Planctomycetaceae bacterium]|nr:DUF1501 domain-containing protein [Planctomycetaceae bacterium]